MVSSRRIVCISGVALVAAACGSVPQVSYGAADGGSAASRDGSTPPTADAAGDAGNDAGDPNACPNKPPSGGICCGSTPCIGCQSSDCASCTMKACSTSEACCPAGPNHNLACKNPQSC